MRVDTYNRLIFILRSLRHEQTDRQKIDKLTDCLDSVIEALLDDVDNATRWDTPKEFKDERP